MDDSKLKEIADQIDPALAEQPPAQPMPGEVSSPDDPAGAAGAPGEATLIYMTTAGLFRRRFINIIVAIVGITGTVALVTAIALDLAGAIEIPAFGFLYDYTGVEDPSIARATARVESKLLASDLSDEQRKALKEKLLGLRERAQTDGAEPHPKKAKLRRRKKTPVAEQGIKEKKTLTTSERSLAMDVFSDDRKQEARLKLASPEELRTPNLPEGLTQESIFAVISENNRSMSLCFTEAMRKGEKLTGKMEVQLTISATGVVGDVAIPETRFRNSAMAGCTKKRLKTWKFPRFNGQPVTVVFPYVLSVGF